MKKMNRIAAEQSEVFEFEGKFYKRDSSLGEKDGIKQFILRRWLRGEGGNVFYQIDDINIIIELEEIYKSRSWVMRSANETVKKIRCEFKDAAGQCYLTDEFDGKSECLYNGKEEQCSQFREDKDKI